MDSKTKEILVTSIVEGGGDFHKSKKKYKELQKKKSKSPLGKTFYGEDFEDMCKQILGFKK